MTLIQSILPNHLSPPLRRVIQLCWSSTRGGFNGQGRQHFMLDIDLDAESFEQATVEAWVECSGGRRCVLDRQQLNVAACIEEQMLHIDVMGCNGDGRIAAVSIFASEHQPLGNRPVFAQTTLLAKAGFAAGSYDPPMLTEGT